MKIEIIGGGWYGCHIALELLKLHHEVILYEKGKQLFSGASAANQSRLHLGFHYPRCYKTRREAIDGKKDFIAYYPGLCRAIPSNIYAVANDFSLMDWMTFCQVMTCENVGFSDLQPEDFGIRNVEGMMSVGERLILEDKARAYFANELDGVVQYQTEIDHDDVREARNSNDRLIIDCTYGSFGHKMIHHYEPCIMLVYTGPKDFALTIMDGPFGVSIYPWWDEKESGITMTSVKFTPLAKCTSYIDALRYIQPEVAPGLLNRVIDEMEKQISRYLPSFQSMYNYHKYLTSIRLKPATIADTRTCMIEREGNLITVLPGKISAIFKAFELVKNLLGKE